MQTSPSHPGPSPTPILFWFPLTPFSSHCPRIKVFWGSQFFKVWTQHPEGGGTAEQQGEDMGRSTHIIWMQAPACQDSAFHARPSCLPACLPSFLPFVHFWTSFNRISFIIWLPGYPVPSACPPSPICGHSAVLQERDGPCTHHQGPERSMSMATRSRQGHGRWAGQVKSPLVPRAPCRGSRL